MTGAPGQGRDRLDIQALRALAVGLVVLWHAGVPGIPGRFVGVDVFFVISGFLMVQLLIREMERTGGLRAGAFYYRRARRLLPVALTVLVATLLMTWLMLPSTVWRGVGLDVLSSAFYVVNWRLAVTEVDYLAADALPSPVQHYWSLSVEEQFYLLLPLPLALLAALWLAKQMRATKPGTGNHRVVPPEEHGGWALWRSWCWACPPCSGRFWRLMHWPRGTTSAPPNASGSYASAVLSRCCRPGPAGQGW